MKDDAVLQIDYNEIPVRDFDAAKRFYGRAFGWTFVDYGPGPNYVAFANAGLDGGFDKSDAPPTRGGALIILKADDLEAAEKRVEDAGGKIVSRYDFPGGRRFHFIDPSGNELAVWSPQGQYGNGGDNGGGG